MKVAIYCRLSEEDRNKATDTDDSHSIQNQKAMLLRYAAEQNWDVYGVYSDDDYTGADRRRPAFNRLLADAQAHRFDIVLCKTQSRFTRELELVEKYIHGLFPIWGIRFVSIVDNADTLNKGNKKSRQINGLVNEWYLEDLSENIRSVLTNRRQSGLHIGSFALYGYKKDPEQKGHLIMDEEAAAIVREVFTLFSQGYGKTAIARMLNDRGIPNPTEYKRLHGLRYKQPTSRSGTLWKYSAISAMLTNEIYIGNMVQGRYGSVSYKTKQNKPRPKNEWFVVENTHEPIIDRALWTQVQTMLAARAKPFDTGTVGLFAGKARCKGCGYTLHSAKSHGRRYLQCPTRSIAKDTCVGAFIAVDVLEKSVRDELNRLTALYLDQDELARHVSLCNGLQAQKKRLLADLTAQEKSMANCTRALQALYMDKVKGIISESDYLDMAKALTANRDRLAHAIADGQKLLAEIDDKLAAGDDPRTLLEWYTHPEHLTREIMDAMVDFIAVGKRVTGTKTVPIEIHWRF